MKILLSSYHPYRIVDEIAAFLGKESEQHFLEKSVALDKERGRGKISGFEFSDGIGLILISTMFKEDWTLEFKSKTLPSLIFKFSIEGGIFHSIKDDFISYQLNEMQGSITANTRRDVESFRLPANCEVTYAMILMNRKSYMTKVDNFLDEMPVKLKNVISDIQAEKVFFYEGNYSVGVADIIQDINKDKNFDIVRATYVEGKTLELLSKLIKQYWDDLRPTTKQVMLRKYDLDNILKAKEIIMDNLREPPTIEELSKTVGINQTKLKKGFKQVFDSTIKGFIINRRLELARLLLLKNDDSVQDIAELVGYTNKSHFSRIFQRRFGVLPKDFHKKITSKVDLLKLY